MAGTNFLERFRPLGAPGAATSSGVPAADDRGPAAELAPVFAALAPTVGECDALVEDATRVAARKLGEAREHASAIVAHARLDVGTEQAVAADRILAAAALDDAHALAAAGRAGAEIRRTGAARLDDAAAQVLERLLTDLLGDR